MAKYRKKRKGYKAAKRGRSMTVPYLGSRKGKRIFFVGGYQA